jgi:hypothetical protein
VANVDTLAYVYFEDEEARWAVMKRLTREDARRLATQIARLPELLDELRRLRVARDEPAWLERRSETGGDLSFLRSVCMAWFANRRHRILFDFWSVREERERDVEPKSLAGREIDDELWLPR